MNINKMLIEKKNDNVLILTDNILNVNKIIERLVLAGQDVVDVEVKKPIDIAIDIINTYNAKHNIIEPLVQVSINDGSIFIENIIKDNAKDFKYCRADSMCKKTAIEILENINMIRQNKTNENYDNAKDNKIIELKNIINEYEKKLKEKNLYDECMIFDLANDCFEKDNSLYQINENVKCYKIEFDNRFNYKTNEFIKKIYKSKIQDIENIICEANNDVSFKKCYGIFSEVYDALKDICGANNNEKMCYGDVEIMYTSDEYVPYIKSIFGENNIDVRFVSGYSALCNNYIKLLVDLLSFARNGFIYEELKSVCFNKIINMDNIQYLYIRNIGSGIKKGISQFENFIEIEKNNIAEEKKEIDINDVKKVKFNDSKNDFVDFVSEIINLFKDENQNAIDILNGAMEIIDNRVFNCKEKNLGRMMVRDIKNAIEYVEGENLEKKIDIILDEIKNIKICDEEDNNAITIDRFDGYKIVNRKNVFILGLSAKHYDIKTTESPVLLDEEREKYFDMDVSNVELKSEESKYKSEKLMKTINAFDNAKVIASMSNYDVLSHMELAESIFYNQLIENSKENIKNINEYHNIIKNTTEFNKNDFYDNINMTKNINEEENQNNKGNIEENNDVNGLTDNEIDKIKQQQESTTNEDNNDIDDNDIIQLSFSQSTLNIFKECALKYHYAKELHILEEEYEDVNDGRWLDAASTGTYVHKILQLYVDNCFKDKKNTEIKNEVDEEIFKSVCEAADEYIININPVESENETKYVLDKNKEKIKKYLENMHKEFSSKDNEWIVCGNEYKFEYIKEIEIGDKQKKKAKIKYHGYIDRIDYRMEGNIKHIRIIDYKTGKYVEDKYLESVQQDIYADYFRSLDNVVIDEFVYKFLLEEGDTNEEKYESKDIGNPIKKYSLGGKLYDVFINKIYDMDIKALYNEVREKVEEKSSGTEVEAKIKSNFRKVMDEHCKYCNYTDICIKKVGDYE